MLELLLLLVLVCFIYFMKKLFVKPLPEKIEGARTKLKHLCNAHIPSNNANVTLSNLYLEFDEERNLFLSTFSKELRHFSRNHGIPLRIVHDVLRYLTEKGLEHSESQQTLSIQLDFAQVLEYGVKNCKQTDIYLRDEIIYLTKTILSKTSGIDKSIRSEVAIAFASMIQNEWLSFEEIKNLDLKGITEDINPDAKSSLLIHQYSASRSTYGKGHGRHLKMTNFKPSSYLTKSQQIITTKHDSFESEQTNLVQLNLRQALISRNKRIQNSYNQECLPTHEGISGNDRVWYRDSHQEARFLYELAKSGKLLKDEDKDVWLVNHFIDKGNVYWCYRKYLPLNMFIAETFALIAKKQRLNSKALDKLFSCFDISHKNFDQINKDFSADDAQKLKIHVMTAIALSAKRDVTILTTSRVSILINLVCSNCSDEKLKSQAQDLLLMGGYDDETDGQKFFDVCVNDFLKCEQQFSTKEWTFIMRQIKNPDRCKKWVKPDIVDNLAKLVYTAKSPFSETACEILNNYLGHDFIPPLSDEYLMKFGEILGRQESNDYLQEKILTSILLNFEKKKDMPVVSIPDSVLMNLIDNIEMFSPKSKNLTILSLASICERISISNIGNNLATMLSSNKVIVEDVGGLSFEETCNDNQGSISVSSYVAKIFEEQGKKHRFNYGTFVINNFIDCLGNHFDLQTQIRIAKCLYLTSQHNMKILMDFDQLSQLREFMYSKVFDIRIYSTVAYLTWIDRFWGSIPIPCSHFDNFSKIYAYESTVLGGKDFSDQINLLFLTVLLKQVKINDSPIDEECFLIFENILFNGIQGQDEIVVSILQEYTAKERRLLPDNSILATENVLWNPKLFEEVLSTISNVIYNGQAVSNCTLQIFVDILFEPIGSVGLISSTKKISSDIINAEKSFSILLKANTNQNLSEDIFEILEMERTLDNWYRTAQHCISETTNVFQFFQKCLGRRRKLSTKNLKIIGSLLQSKKMYILNNTLSLLHSALKNKQSIHEDIYTKLSLLLNDDQTFVLILPLFSTLLQNNQSIGIDVLEKLEHRLKKKQHVQQISEFFICYISCNGRIDISIFHQLLQTIISSDENIQWVSAILHYLQNLKKIDSKTAQLASKVFSKALQYNDMVEKSIDGFRILSKTNDGYSLEENDVNILIEKSSHSNDQLKKNIIYFLNCRQLDRTQKDELNLAQLSDQSDTKFLNTAIDLLTKRFSLKSSHWLQFQSIFENWQPEVEVTRRDIVLSLFSDVIGKVKIPNDFLQSISQYLLQSENDFQLWNEFFIDQARNGRIIPRTILNSVICKPEFAQSNLFRDTLVYLSRNQSLPTICQTIVHTSIDLIENQRSIFRNLLREIKSDKWNPVLPEETIKYLLNNSRNDNAEFLYYGAYIIASALLQNVIHSSKEIGHLIERAIILKKINVDILGAYKIIIHENNYTEKLSLCLDVLSQLLNENLPENDYSIEILDCIVQSIKSCPTLSHSNAKLFLQNNVYNDDHAVRRLAFEGLNLINKNDLIFFQFFENNIEFQLLFKSWKDKHELIGWLISVQFLDLKNLSQVDSSNWKREIFLCDLIERVCENATDKYQLYQLIQEIEDYSNQPTVTQILQFICFASDIQSWDSKQSFIALKSCAIIVQHTKKYEHIYRILQYSGQYILKQLEFFSLKTLLLSKIQEKEIESNFQIDKLVYKCRKFISYFQIVQLLNKFQSITSNCKSINQLIELLKEYKLFHLIIEELQDGLSVEDAEKTFKVQILIQKIFRHIDINKQKNSNILIQKITFTLQKIIDNGSISFDNIYNFIHKLKEKNTILISTHSLYYIFKLFQYYTITDSDFNTLCQERFDKIDPKYWIDEVNHWVLKTHFAKGGQVKNTYELVKELYNINPQFQFDLRQKNLENTILTIQSNTYKSKIEKFQLIPISKWEESTISDWAQYVKEKKCFQGDSTFVIEALAVIKQANLLLTSFYTTDVQILCCLLAFKTNNDDYGCLQQVVTGAGKTTIISITAILYALQGMKIDIITSNSVLAQRDAKENQNLYAMFGFTTDHNSEKFLYRSGPKDCYRKDMVYGDVSQFQFDILRDEYSCLNTLGERKSHPQLALVDEVDSMLIDDSSKIARLASTTAGMDLFHPLYHFLWQRLTLLQDKLVLIGEKYYFFFGKLDYVNGKIKLEFTDENDILYEILDLEKFLHTNPDLNGLALVVQGELEEFLHNHLENYWKTLIDQSAEIELFENIKVENRIKIPKHLQHFVSTQIKKWVVNALTALEYEENVHYIVRDGTIKPVDYSTTGVIQDATNWSDGLHQFLQLKHGLKMSCETITTNFLSNMGFFQRYKKQLFGFTGTLGSNAAQQSLSKVYNVRLIFIPQTFKKNYKQLPDIITSNEDDWFEKILDGILLEKSRKRGTLVICETIKTAERITELLRNKSRDVQDSIKLYTQNNNNQEKHVQRVQPGDTIIATNLAGRGTDIKTDEIERFGGLHVILTFLPSNLRVEEQALGRTARQGKCGTSQLIIKIHDVQTSSNETVRQRRDQHETKILDEFLNSELEVISVKDKLFKEFCQLLNDIRKSVREILYAEKGNLQIMKEGVQSFWKAMNPSTFELNLLAAIEERWAMFLRSLEDGNSINLKNAQSKFNTLHDQIKNDFQNNRVIRNPYNHICIGNEQFVSDSKINRLLNKAMASFDSAIEMDAQFSSSALVGKASCLLKGKEAWIGSNDYMDNYKERALLNLNKALPLLHDEMAVLTAVQSITHQEQNNDLAKQLIVKMNILGTYLNSVTNAIAILNRSRRLVDINVTTENGQIKTYFGLERNKTTRLIPSIKEMGQTNIFEVIFNDLTVQQDSGTIDQAVETIKISSQARDVFARDGKYEPSNDCWIIQTKPIQVDQYLTFINRHISLCDISQEVALAQLKETSSVIQQMLPKNWSWDSTKLDIDIIENNGHKVDSYSKKSFVEADNLIRRANSNATFNMKIIDGNIHAWKVIQNTQLEIQLQQLKAEDLKCLTLKLATDFKLSVEIMGPSIKLPTDALLFNQVLIQDVAMDISARTMSMTTVTAKECKNWKHLKFNNIENRATLLGIVELNPKCIFNFCIKFINYGESLQLLQNLSTSIICRFENLTNSTAQALIPHLRNANLDFSIILSNLSLHHAESIIANARLEQEHIEVKSVKRLSECFLQDATPWNELREYSARGIEYLIEFSEKKFVPWWSITSVCIIATIQMMIGGILIASGFGATLGMGLITEGVADLFIAYRAYSTRQFSWSDYGKQKAVSLAISAVSMGWSSIKNGVKGAKVIITGATTELAEQVGTQVIMNGKAVGNVIVKSAKNLKSLAYGQVMVAVGEAGTREVLNNVMSGLTDFALSETKPMISKQIELNVRVMFHKEELRQIVSKMYSLDHVLNQNILTGKIDQILSDFLNPQHNFWSKQWNSIGMPLCKGILSDRKYLGSKFSMALRITATLNGLYQFNKIMENVYQELIKKLVQFQDDSLCRHHVIHMFTKKPLHEAKKIAEGNFMEDQDIRKFFQAVEKTEKTFEMENIFPILKLVSDGIAGNVLRVLESEMISPWTTFAVSSVTNTISVGIQKGLLGSTVSEQIGEAAKQFTVAYSQAGMIVPAIDENKGGKLGEEQAQFIEDVKHGKPAGLIEMGYLAKKNGLNLRIVDDPNYVITNEDIRSNAKVVLYTTDPNGGIGHYQLMDSHGQFMKIPESNRPNDCGYDVISALTNKSVDQLRHDIVSAVTVSPETFKKAIEAKVWIQDHYPTESNKFIFVGGARKQRTTLANKSDIVQMIERSNLIRFVDDNSIPSLGGMLELFGENLLNEIEELRNIPELFGPTSLRVLETLDTEFRCGDPTQEAEGTKPIRKDPITRLVQGANKVIKFNAIIHSEKPVCETELPLIVAGHLKSQKLGGRGDSCNMIPMTRSANMVYEERYESNLKKLAKMEQYKNCSVRLQVRVNYANTTWPIGFAVNVEPVNRGASVETFAKFRKTFNEIIHMPCSYFTNARKSEQIFMQSLDQPFP